MLNVLSDEAENVRIRNENRIRSKRRIANEQLLVKNFFHYSEKSKPNLVFLGISKAALIHRVLFVCCVLQETTEGAY